MDARIGYISSNLNRVINEIGLHPGIAITVFLRPQTTGPDIFPIILIGIILCAQLSIAMIIAGFVNAARHT